MVEETRATATATTAQRKGGAGERPEPKGAPSDRQAAQAVDLDFQLLFSALYHDMCETTLMRKHRSLTAINLLLGSGAAVAIGAQYPVVAQIAGGLVAVVGAIQLVWDFGKVARDHAVLRQRYYDLLADLHRGKDRAELTAMMTTLFGAEPPISERLRRRAHTRAAKSLYGDDFIPA